MDESFRVRVLCKELCQPVYDNMVDFMVTMYSNVMSKFPRNMTESEKGKILEGLIKTQVDKTTEAFKNIDIEKLKTDLDKELGKNGQ